MPQAQYAVRLSDLFALSELHPLRWLLAPFLTRQIVDVSPGQFDAAGIVINPDVPDRDWSSALQVALSADMPCGYPIRIYEKKSSAWTRIRPEGQAAYKPATSVEE